MALSDQAPSFVPDPQWLRSPQVSERELSWTFLVVLTLVGAALRVYELTGQSLSVDELLTWQAIRPGDDLSFWQQITETIQGPLYVAVVWPLLQAQDSALMLRLPAVVAGIVAVPLFGWLAFRSLNGRAARLALLFFALNPFHIWYSQEGRGTSFLILLSIVMALIYLTMVQRRASPAGALVFGLSGAALLLSNLSGAVLLAGMALTLILLHRPAQRQRWAWWVCAFGLAGLLAAPWLLKASGIWTVDHIVPGAGTGEALRGETAFSLLALPYAFYTLCFGSSLGPSLRELHQPDRLATLQVYWPVLAAGAVAVSTSVLAGVFGPDRRRMAFLIWIVVPLGLLVLLAVCDSKPWNPRFVAVVLPWLMLFISAGLARLPRRPGLAVTVVLVGLTLWSLAGYYTNEKFAKADLRQAVALVAQAAPPNQVVLVPVVTAVYRYYDRDRQVLLDNHGRSPLPDRAAASSFVAEVLGAHDRCRVVLAREWSFDPGGHLLPALSRVGNLRLENQLPGVSIYSWERTANLDLGQESGQ